MTRQPTPSVGQPDAEPSSNEFPNGTASSGGFIDFNGPVEIPVPNEDQDDECLVSQTDHDYWEVQDQCIIRHHRIPRIHMFFPTDTWETPFEVETLDDSRHTKGQFLSGSTFERKEPWRNNVAAHQPTPEPWTGTTIFFFRRDLITCNEFPLHFRNPRHPT